MHQLPDRQARVPISTLPGARLLRRMSAEKEKSEASFFKNER
jgi:hypothetical protein